MKRVIAYLGAFIAVLVGLLGKKCKDKRSNIFELLTPVWSKDNEKAE